MHRYLSKAIRLNLKHTPNRHFTTSKDPKDPKNQQEATDDNIWEDVDEDNETDTTSKKSQYLRLIKNTVLWGLFGWLGANAYYSVQSNFDEEEAKSQALYNHYIFTVSNKITKELHKAYNYILYPPVTKFLPDEPPLRPELLRKTLVLNFEGTLYAKDFSAGSGVLIHLRPGFKKFIDKMSQLYDIVLYSNEDTAFMNEVIQTIDPYQRYFMWNLGREFFTMMPDGGYKDLRFLNRDPKKFIVVDFTTDNYLNNKENVITIDKYHGEMEDNGLKELGLFLEHCAAQNIKDVRREINKYGGEHSAKNYYEDMQKKVDSVKKKRNWLTGYSNKGKVKTN